MAIKQKTHRYCGYPECDKDDGKRKFFKLYKSTDQYCSDGCKKAHKPEKYNLHPKPRTPIKRSTTRIKPVSTKRKEENKIYAELRREFLSKPENKICPITKQPATDVHHKKGRVGSLFLDTRFWVALSREGHRFVEENPEWAKENGYSLNRLS